MTPGARLFPRAGVRCRHVGQVCYDRRKQAVASFGMKSGTAGGVQASRPRLPRSSARDLKSQRTPQIQRVHGGARAIGAVPQPAHQRGASWSTDTHDHPYQVGGYPAMLKCSGRWTERRSGMSHRATESHHYRLSSHPILLMEVTQVPLMQISGVASVS